MTTLAEARRLVWEHYYAIEGKSLEQCRRHGANHRAYCWSPKVDPRWNDDQVRAYLDGYNGVEA